MDKEGRRSLVHLTGALTSDLVGCMTLVCMQRVTTPKTEVKEERSISSLKIRGASSSEVIAHAQQKELQVEEGVCLYGGVSVSKRSVPRLVSVASSKPRVSNQHNVSHYR